ncbi:MAG: prealbumin-like fold domain-containing protein [Lactimicrobium sp.]|uniref:prealbumin-like fold domain-containing protein n=1 Tax=Lactimicrobium sp. TaxID=2563780 RepID=UPI002F352499
MKTVLGKKIGAVICMIAIVLGTLISPMPVLAEDTNTSSAAPMNLADYLTTDYQLSYQDGNDWVTVSDSSTTISMFAKLQFKVRFGGISAQQLYNNDGTLYLDLPSILTNPTVSSGAVQDANGNNAGTITAEGQRITLQVDKTYLSDLLTNEGTDFKIQNGSLTFTATPDPEQIRDNYKQVVKLGNLDIAINFDADSDAKSSDLSLQKSSPEYSEDTDGNSYLSYTLTISAGDADMPAVTVQDHFTTNAGFVDSYVGITSTSVNLTSETSASVYEEIISGSSSSAHGSVKLSVDKSASDPGTMLWTVGNMKANEVRVLHYKVKLSSDYVGTGSEANGAITNTATPYSKTYEHNAVSSSFTPHASAVMTKKAGTVIENKDSTLTIPYTITVTTDSNNTWSLKNLKISDYFGSENTQNADKATLWNAITPTEEFPNLGFHDFTITDGSTTVSVPAGTSSSTAPYYAIKGTNEYPGFNLYIGDAAPGKTLTITVNLTMKPIFTAGQVKINNRASLFSNDKSSLGNKSLSGGSDQTSFEQQHWDRKIIGAATKSAILQSPTAGNSVYTYSNSTWSKSSSNSAIEVPAGSYEYQVVVNENAIWDVSSSQFNDTLGNNGQYLHYAGYLRLDYYEDGVNSSVSNGSDSDVVKAMEARKPTETIWLNINDMTSFNLSPKQLESTFGKGSFLLTYYAKPITGAFSSVKTSNTFTLSGTIIGTGGTSYILPAMSVKTNVTVTGSTDYSAHKYAWYYDPNDTSNGFDKGKLYWIITVDGTKVPAGMQLHDVPGTTPSHATKDSIVGIYFGNTPDEGSSVTETYGNYAELSADSSFEQIDSSNYTWELDGNGPGTLTFNNDIAIPNGKTMYIIVAIYPNNKPSDNARTQTTYYNILQERSNSTLGWNDVNTATLYVLGQGTNFKEFGEYGTYNADTKTWSDTQVAPNHAIDRILTSYNTNEGTQTLTSGTYVDYILAINYAGDESGKFKVEDVVPEGMEPVYVRYFWIPDGLRSATNAPTMPEISTDDLGTGNWTDIGVKNTTIDGKNVNFQGSAYAYYDSESRKIVFMADNLQKGTPGQIDKKDLQVQVVMRVTNSDNIMGKDTSYTNTMNVYNSSNNLVTTSKVTTTVKTHTVSKSAGDVSNGSVPFTIAVNPMSLDLSPDTDTLTLVDELGYSTENGVPGSMTVDPSTVTIQDSNGNALDSSLWTLSITKDTANKMTVLTMTVPDGKKLTITYKASIDASPGTPVTYTNTAHWYGLSTDSYNTVTKTVSYNVDASFGFSNSPVINLIKADQDNVTRTLSGAVFELYKATQADDGKWTYTGDPLEAATTDSNGKLTFETGTAELQFNTVYAIVEKYAPAGYVRNTSPILIAMARADSKGNYPNESTEWGSTVDSSLVTNTADQVAAWANQGVTVNYRGSTYTYTAYNHKASLNLVKEFQDKDGSTLTTPPDGTFSFGLYNTDNNLVETLTITYSNGTASYQLTENGVTKRIGSAEFLDLNVGDSYSVYELDGNGDKVKTGHILYNKEGNGYIASYTLKKTGDIDPVSYDPASDQITVQDADIAGTVTITNQEFSIPETGVYIRDNFWYFVAFLLLDGITICYVLYLKRRFNKSHDR